MPIWLGVQGELVGLRMVAELADGWNFSGATRDEFAPRIDALNDTRTSSAGTWRDRGFSAQMRVDRDDLPDARARASHSRLRGPAHRPVPRWTTGPRSVDLVARDIVGPLRDAFS